MNTKLFFAPALLVVSSVGFAGSESDAAGQAQSVGGQAQTVISELDADQDGAISKTEASASDAVMQSFAAIDRNGDSSISQGELSSYLAQQQGGAEQPDPSSYDSEEEEAE